MELALDKSDGYDSFENYFTENNSCDFINRISDISDASLEDTRCNINKVDSYNVEDSIYYKVVSEVEYKQFDKAFVAYIKIKNPFLKEKDSEKTDQNEITESEENNIDEATDKNKEYKKQIKPSDLVVVFNCEEV